MMVVDVAASREVLSSITDVNDKPAAPHMKGLPPVTAIVVPEV